MRMCSANGLTVITIRPAFPVRGLGDAFKPLLVLLLSLISILIVQFVLAVTSSHGCANGWSIGAFNSITDVTEASYAKLELAHDVPDKAPNGPPPIPGLLVWTSPQTISSDWFEDFINSPRPVQGCGGPV